LSDKEYQLMRDASIACLREIGVDTGGSNVQFAVDPETGKMVIIEMNPRVSRSSALASKATGFPIAKIAAKLAVGYTLDELDNDITRVTPASFEPTIDYVVTKMPRFTFEKFPGAEPTLTTAMKSVGEAMSIGRSFAESLQKALRSMETGLTGLNEVRLPGVVGKDGAVDREELLIRLGEGCRTTASSSGGSRGWAFATPAWRSLPVSKTPRSPNIAETPASYRFTSASTPAPPSSLRSRPTSIPPTRPVTPRPAAIQSSLARPGPANGTR
jgi:hypothetical protein